MNDKDIAEIVSGSMAEAGEDFVGLWQIVRELRERGITDAADVRGMTMTVCKELLDHGLLFGQFVEDGSRFEPWTHTPTAVFDRIGREWDQLGRDPDISEIGWFADPQHVQP